MRSGSVEDAPAEPSVVEAQYEPVPAVAEPALAGRSAR